MVRICSNPLRVHLKFYIRSRKSDVKMLVYQFVYSFSSHAQSSPLALSCHQIIIFFNVQMPRERNARFFGNLEVSEYLSNIFNGLNRGVTMAWSSNGDLPSENFRLQRTFVGEREWHFGKPTLKSSSEQGRRKSLTFIWKVLFSGLHPPTLSSYHYGLQITVTSSWYPPWTSFTFMCL